MRKRILSLLPLALLLIAVLCVPALALTESEVEAQVAATSKEAVTGNVLIWFLCAVAFLKVSQKVDSLLSTLGINVGRTGGPLLADAMVAAKGVAMIAKGGGRAIGSMGKQSGGSASASAPGSVGGFFKGGLIGMAGRHITSTAVKTATTQTAAMHTAQKQSAASATHTAAASQSEGIHTANSTHSGAHTASSVQSGGTHTASATQSGVIHMANPVQPGGINPASPAQSGGVHAVGGPQPGGGPTDTTGIIQTENSVQSATFQSDNSMYSGQDHTSSESASDSSMFADSMVQQDGVIYTGHESQSTTFSDSSSQISTPDSGPAPSGSDMGPAGADIGPASQPGTIITSQPGHSPSPQPGDGSIPQPGTVSTASPGGVSAPSSQTVNSQQVSQAGGTSQVSQPVSSSQTIQTGGGSHTHTQSGTVQSHTQSRSQSSTQSSWQPNTQTVRQTSIGGAVFARSLASGGRFANDVIGTVAKGDIRSTGSITGDLAAQSLGSYMGYTALGAGAQNVPRYSDVEIGGGRITGTEYKTGSQDGLAFGMYHAAQYTAPDGPHEKVYSADGTLWYKQYAQDTVERKPYKAPDGSVAYDEKIVKKLPNPPKRKDRI